MMTSKRDSLRGVKLPDLRRNSDFKYLTRHSSNNSNGSDKKNGAANRLEKKRLDSLYKLEKIEANAQLPVSMRSPEKTD